MLTLSSAAIKTISLYDELATKLASTSIITFTLPVRPKIGVSKLATTEEPSLRVPASAIPDSCPFDVVNASVIPILVAAVAMNSGY